PIMRKALDYLDAEILKDFERLLEQAAKIKENTRDKAAGIQKEKDYLASNHLSSIQVQYLYMRSFYVDVAIPEKVQKAVDYYRNQAATFWLEQPLSMKGMIALVQYRVGNKQIS